MCWLGMGFEEEHGVGLGLGFEGSMTLGWVGWVLPNVVIIDSPMSAKPISVAMATARQQRLED